MIWFIRLIINLKNNHYIYSYPETSIPNPFCINVKTLKQIETNRTVGRLHSNINKKTKERMLFEWESTCRYKITSYTISANCNSVSVNVNLQCNEYHVFSLLTPYRQVTEIPKHDKTRVISGNGQLLGMGFHYLKPSVLLHALWHIATNTVLPRRPSCLLWRWYTWHGSDKLKLPFKFYQFHLKLWF